MKIILGFLLGMNVAIGSDIVEPVPTSMNCRDAVVDAYSVLGKSIERESFSSTTFDEFGISIADFNALPSSDQVAIYEQIKPMSVMVESSIAMLNANINEVAGTFYEVFMRDELQMWRGARDQLRSCTHLD